MASINRFTLVQIYGSLNDKPSVLGWAPAGYEEPALVSGHIILGVTVTESDYEQPIAVMKRGYLRGVDEGAESWAVGDILYGKNDGTVTKVRPDAPLPQVLVGTVFADEGAGLFTVDVDVRVLPNIGELTGVKRETPADLDVLIFDGAAHYYEPRRLTASDVENVPSGSVSDTDVQAAIDAIAARVLALEQRQTVEMVPAIGAVLASSATLYAPTVA